MHVAPFGKEPGINSESAGSDLGESDSAYLPAAQPFSTDTVIMLAYDTERSMMTLSDSMLADRGISFITALAAATENLRDATVANFEQIAPGLFLGTWNDSYDTSRMLFPDMVYQIGMSGEPLVMIPTRSRFMVVASNDRAA